MESQVEQLKKFLKERFDIELPSHMMLVEHQNVIRLCGKDIMRLKGKGYPGFVAGRIRHGRIEVKNEFFQLLGHLAKKNIISLNEEEARQFVEQPFIEKEIENGYYIAKYGRHVLGICWAVDNRLYTRFVGKGRKRVRNHIKP